MRQLGRETSLLIIFCLSKHPRTTRTNWAKAWRGKPFNQKSLIFTEFQQPSTNDLTCFGNGGTGGQTLSLLPENSPKTTSVSALAGLQNSSRDTPDREPLNASLRPSSRLGTPEDHLQRWCRFGAVPAITLLSGHSFVLPLFSKRNESQKLSRLRSSGRKFSAWLDEIAAGFLYAASLSGITARSY
jgi:hypothetical protein